MKTRTARAIGVTNMNAYARSLGMKSAQEYTDHLRLHRRLDTGGRITARDIERVRERDPHIPLAALNRLADWVNEGANGRERADRYSDAVAGGIEQANGITIDRHAMRERARVEGEQFEVGEFADAATGKMDSRDGHVDRNSGIDQARRVEQAKRAALQNPDNQRRADIERVVEQQAPTPKFYANGRREILAQASERIAERMMKQQVRDADPSRRADRSDDRTSDIRLAFDTLEVNDAARDELTIASNPLLEQVDDALTESGASRESE